MTPQDRNGFSVDTEKRRLGRKLRGCTQHLGDHLTGGTLTLDIVRDALDVAENAFGAVLKALALFRRKRFGPNDSTRERRIPLNRAGGLHARLREKMRVVLTEAIAQDADQLVVAIDEAFAVNVEWLALSARCLSEALRHERVPLCGTSFVRDYLTARA
jgi:hypothetical protein